MVDEQVPSPRWTNGRQWIDAKGQAVPLVLVAGGMAVVVTLGIAQLGRSVFDAGRARTAADAAALAGVDGGRAASERLAAEHGADIVEWWADGPPDGVTVTVTVRVGRARATASASNVGDPGRAVTGAPPG